MCKSSPSGCSSNSNINCKLQDDVCVVFGNIISSALLEELSAEYYGSLKAKTSTKKKKSSECGVHDAWCIMLPAAENVIESRKHCSDLSES